MKLLDAVAERETAAIELKRDDLEVDTRDAERQPRVVAQGETQPLELGGAQARLYGDAGASAGWSVDNFVLLEVLDPAGTVMRRAVVGFAEAVLVGNETIDYVGPKSFRFEAGEVNLTSLLPEEGIFKVRATALDYSGVGRVSDLYLVLEPDKADRADDDLKGL